VCAAYPTSRLNLKLEFRPSWNNIHDTFPTGTTQDTTSDPPAFSSEKSHEKECVNKNLDVFVICLGVAVVQCSYHYIHSLCHCIFLSISSVFFCPAASYHL